MTTTFLHRVLTAAVLVALPAAAEAGPPLICHPFDIGTARSLPIGPADGGWSSIDASYDRSRVIADTRALLTPSTPTLVRMETLRRAALYVADDQTAARALLQALREGMTKAPATRAEALGLFDVGYLVETYRQLGTHKPALTAAAGDLDGYALVARSLQVTADDKAMHLAAALITLRGPHAAAYQEHARQAHGASGDALLARNLRTHLQKT